VNGAAIAARGLTKRFGHAVALDGLDLDLDAGVSLAVLGPNGAGKSTLLRGLARPTAGKLRIDGEDAQQRQARARVGYIGHATLLYPALTARENLIFAARMHGVADPAGRAQALLEDEGLGSAADLLVGGFSRGMAQRVAIARGLVNDPAIVLLDEPFTGLDRRAAERLAERLETLRAAQLAHAALVLDRGRIVHRSEGPADPQELERAYLAALEAAP